MGCFIIEFAIYKQIKDKYLQFYHALVYAYQGAVASRPCLISQAAF
jgi:hypothetical protein